MYSALIVLHLFTAFVMVGAILLQAGKGAEIGATFGGSSQTLFGGRGATTFLAKFTVICGAVFMLTSLSLAILAKERSIGSSIDLPSPPTAEATDSSGTEAAESGAAVTDTPTSFPFEAGEAPADTPATTP